MKELQFENSEKNIFELKMKNQRMREEKEKMVDDIKIVRAKLNGAKRLREAAIAEKDSQIENLKKQMEEQELEFKKV